MAVAAVAKPTTPAELAAGPVLALDLDVITARYESLRDALGAELFFAIKANAHPAVILALRNAGSGFDVASAHEAELAARLGVAPAKMIFSAPVRTDRDLQVARDLGVGLYVADSLDEVSRLRRLGAPVDVLLRLAVDSLGSRWSLSTKFGAAIEHLPMLANVAADGGLRVRGVSFHVGSQAESLGVWARAVHQAGRALAQLAADGHDIAILNLGGGFPVHYDRTVPAVGEIAEEIKRAVADHAPQATRLLAEPGRYLVAEAGAVRATVLSTSMRGDRRWIYLNAGSFNGLFEAGRNGGALPLPIRLERRPASDEEVLSVFAGSSCDGDDVLGEERAFAADVHAGDMVTIGNAGAYSLSYVTPLCGLEPIRVIADTRARSADLGDGHSAHRCVVSDPGFAACIDLERAVFEGVGFLGSDGTLEEFREYDQQSSFVMLEKDGIPIACLREILPGPLPLKTLKDFAIFAGAKRWLAEVGPSHITEIGTVSTLPRARGATAAQHCYAVAWASAIARGTTHWVASIDSDLLEYFRTVYGFDFVDLGPEEEYFGSPTTPVALDLRETEKIRATHPDMASLLARAPVLDGRLA